MRACISCALHLQSHIHSDHDITSFSFLFLLWGRGGHFKAFFSSVRYFLNSETMKVKNVWFGFILKEKKWICSRAHTLTVMGALKVE